MTLSSDDHADDPEAKIAKFRTNTGNSNLRKHLFTQHLHAWVAECNTLNISITAKAAVNVIRESQGLSIEMEGKYLDLYCGRV
jgi:hypothetical protein